MGYPYPNVVTLLIIGELELNKPGNWLIDPEALTWRGDRLVAVAENVIFDDEVLRSMHAMIEKIYRPRPGQLAASWNTTLEDGLFPSTEEFEFVRGLRARRFYCIETTDVLENELLAAIIDSITLLILQKLYVPPVVLIAE